MPHRLEGGLMALINSQSKHKCRLQKGDESVFLARHMAYRKASGSILKKKLLVRPS